MKFGMRRLSEKLLLQFNVCMEMVNEFHVFLAILAKIKSK